jgi:N utilization substance protein A
MMNKIDIIESFAGLKDEKNIDRVTMISLLEEIFRDILDKKYGTSEKEEGFS